MAMAAMAMQNMKSIADRLSSFETWPISFINKDTLAAAGFYYLKPKDIVQCAFCGIELGSWEEGDDPLKDHQRWSPDCPFLRSLFKVSKQDCSAVPSNRNNSDICGPYQLILRPNSYPEADFNERNNKTARPSHPLYMCQDYREKSFETWPLSLKLRPEQLSEAGFYYTGKGDQTVCFYCGGKLKEWKDTDDPWVEHAKWYPDCKYLLMHKGKEFVEKACIEKKTLHSCGEEQKSEATVQGVETGSSCHKQELPAKDRLCRECHKEERQVVFLPCGHLVTCAKCARSVTCCVVCHKQLCAFVKVLWS